MRSPRRKLSRRRRRTRGVTGFRVRALAIAAALAVVAACGSETRAPAPRDEPTVLEPTAEARAHEPFVPPTYREGDKIVMPVAFPDGTTAEVLYPPELRLAERGIRPYGSGGFPGCPHSCFSDFDVFRGDAYFREGRRLNRRYAGAGGSTVELWEAVGATTEPARYLVFRFGRWYVGVGVDFMTSEQLGIWARTLAGRVTQDGFLVFHTKPPLRLARFGEHAGPELMLDDISVILKPG